MKPIMLEHITTNAKGTSYGKNSYKIKGPVLSTKDATEITQTSAKVGGTSL